MTAKDGAEGERRAAQARQRATEAKVREIAAHERAVHLHQSAAERHREQGRDDLADRASARAAHPEKVWREAKAEQAQYFAELHDEQN